MTLKLMVEISHTFHKLWLNLGLGLFVSVVAHPYTDLQYIHQEYDEC